MENTNEWKRLEMKDAITVLTKFILVKSYVPETATLNKQLVSVCH